MPETSSFFLGHDDDGAGPVGEAFEHHDLPTNLDWDSLLDVRWVSLTEAETSVGVSRSALRSWYRSGQIPSRLVDGPFGPQREVPIEAVLARAANSTRITRKVGREVTLEAEVALLRDRVEELETRIADLEGRK
ncbi:MAG: excisionase [Acidimicrobiia bacterium]